MAMGEPDESKCAHFRLLVRIMKSMPLREWTLISLDSDNHRNVIITINHTCRDTDMVQFYTTKQEVSIQTNQTTALGLK